MIMIAGDSRVGCWAQPSFNGRLLMLLIIAAMLWLLLHVGF
jgi:hypothetical protein